MRGRIAAQTIDDPAQAQHAAVTLIALVVVETLQQIAASEQMKQRGLILLMRRDGELLRRMHQTAGILLGAKNIDGGHGGTSGLRWIARTWTISKSWAMVPGLLKCMMFSFGGKLTPSLNGEPTPSTRCARL